MYSVLVFLLVFKIPFQVLVLHPLIKGTKISRQCNFSMGIFLKLQSTLESSGGLAQPQMAESHL